MLIITKDNLTNIKINPSNQFYKQSNVNVSFAIILYDLKICFNFQVNCRKFHNPTDSASIGFTSNLPGLLLFFEASAPSDSESIALAIFASEKFPASSVKLAWQVANHNPLGKLRAYKEPSG